MAQNPKLREDLKITRQVQKDGVHFVIKDPVSQEYFRFPEDEFFVIELFNGTRSIAEIVKDFQQKHPELEIDGEVAQEFYNSLNKLNLLEKSLSEQNLMLLENMRDQRKSKLLGAKGSLMYFRVSLLDPDRLLNVLYPWIKWIFTPRFTLIAGMGILLAVYIIFQRQAEFAEGIKSITTFSDKSPMALLGLWATVVIVIFFHELGHAFTCKHFGGEVHEMGLLMLFFTPCFYANVNDAWTFPKRYQKLLVTFAGGIAEFYIGTIATYCWFLLNPGSIASSVCYQVMTICAVSSVMFNFNPLMKLDGYYAFSDFVEIPNLKAESAGYVKYIVQKYIFRLSLPEDKEEFSLREKRILFGYGVCSVMYMTGVMLGLFFMARGLLVDNFKGIGVILSFLVAWKLFKGHVMKLKGFIKNFAEQKGGWIKSHPIISGLIVMILVSGASFGISQQTLTLEKNCSLLPVNQTKIYAPISGFLISHKLLTGQSILKGERVGVLEDPKLDETIKGLELKREQQKLVLFKALQNNQLRDINRGQLTLAQLEKEIEMEKSKLEKGMVLADQSGVVVTSQTAKGYQPYFKKGSELYEITDLKSFFVEFELLESELGNTKLGDLAELRLHGRPHKVIEGNISSIAPASTDYIAEEEEKGIETKFKVKITILPTEEKTLFPDMNGTIRIFQGKVSGFKVLWHGFKQAIRPDLFI